ncbi:MAG TPA: universal stress protein, partial [Fodinibius sp.]|nr:universal stress protein [Fodinibius sp.]
VANNGNSEKYQNFLRKLSDKFNQEELVTKVVEDENASSAILDEAKKDYDLLVLGATESQPNSTHMFNSVVDYLVRVAPCPTMVVQAGNVDKNWSPRRILVPTNGTEAAKNAADLGFAIAKSDREREVSILNVMFRDKHSVYHVREDLEKDLEGFGREIVNELKEMGDAMNVRTHAVVESGENPETVIHEFSRDNQIDLVILGTNIRPGSRRLYLGARTENVITNAPCPVVIFNS